MSLPPVLQIRQLDTHRLIPPKYGDSVLVRIADDDDHLGAIFDLDRATNDRLLAENDLLPGIGIDELVFGVPSYRFVNAAFCHAHPSGSRFNGPERGAWYAGFTVETAQAEVAWHKTVDLAEIDLFEDSVTYDDTLADFAGPYHDIREDTSFAACLDPAGYEASQALGERLLAAGAAGLVYPSVRHQGGHCLACFRPALVGNVRKDARYRFTWSGTPDPTVSRDG